MVLGLGSPIPTLPRMKLSPKTLVVAVALATIAVACTSGDTAESTTSTTAPTTTTSEPTTTTTSTTTTSTTTTTLAPGIEPTINGLPGEEGTEDRRVVAVKIDNHPAARPQSGLEVADAAYEVLVEGGLTRFIAMFQQSDSDFIGPNRSGRPTDSGLMAALDGAFQISGAQLWVQNIFRSDGVHVVYDNGVTTYRMDHRSAPHNLYTSSGAIRLYADDKEWPDEAPPALFVYGHEPTEAAESAEVITFDWSNQPDVNWTWDGEQYLRFNGTTPHEWIDADDNTGQVSTDTLVVIMGDKYTAKDPAGAGSSVPAIHTTGSGEALVFHSGGVFEATWERETVQDMIRVVDETGNDVILPPGRVWINIFPDSRTVTWE
jgi:hypothetical protein